MMKEFKGRVVSGGTIEAEAVVSHQGLNTLASFQKALQFGDKKATCGDQNNKDLYNKPMAGKALCLPQQREVLCCIVHVKWEDSLRACFFQSP